MPLLGEEGGFGLEEEGAAAAVAGRRLGEGRGVALLCFGGRMGGGALDGEGAAT